jgi:hypothetical protein
MPTLNCAVLKDAAGAYREKRGAACWKLLDLDKQLM